MYIRRERASVVHETQAAAQLNDPVGKQIVSMLPPA
jgi:hypothetical protein